MTRFAALAVLLLLAGCAKDEELRPYAVVRRADVWQAVILEADRGRLARLNDAWEEAQADIEKAGDAAALAALGPAALHDEVPELGQARPAVVMPDAGQMQCRVIKLGWRQGAPQTVPPVQAGAWGPCSLVADGVLLRFETTGSVQQFRGTLYPDGERLIFLGSVRLVGEMGWRRYGEDATRDQLGVLTAIGPAAWRIALPWPSWSARLLIIEMRQP